MCGIVGGFGSRCQKRDILTGLELLQHRGKDEQFFAQCASHAFLGMNRLSIQDSQPGLYPFKYKQYSLLLNGELYNLAELTKHLLKKGIKCKTKCDAEVILPLFDLYGSEAFKMLDGMFAIAIYDEQRKAISLARDLFGEKPLYYTVVDDSLFFASETQALPAFTHQIDESAIPEFLTFGFLNSSRTFYKQVMKVLPGEFVQISHGKVIKNQFDVLSNYLDTRLDQATTESTSNELEKRLQKITHKKIAGESPIGLFLSGGLDSSLLAALLQKETKNKLFTYSIGFEKANHDESREAKLVSEKLQTKHQHLLFSEKEIAPIWHQIHSRGDEPFTDPAILPTFLLAKAAKKDVKVVLTGEGADEIFGGYRRYQRYCFSQKTQNDAIADLIAKKLPVPLNLFKLFASPQKSYTPVSYGLFWNTHRKVYLDMIEKVWQETIELEPNMKNLSIPQSLQLHDLRHYVSEQLCMKTDKILMQHDIESRAPYLDKTLLPYMQLAGRDMASSPTSENKQLLREVASRYLPDEIVHKPKHGFSLPIGDLLQHSLREDVEKLYKAHPLLTNYLNPKEITAVLDSFFQGNVRKKNDVWNLLTINTWLTGQNNP